MDFGDISLVILMGVTFAAFFAGFIDSIAGGGGLITVPALLAAGIPPHFALGTSKLVATSGTSFSLYIYAKGKRVNWRVATFGIPFSIAGSVLGAEIALLLNPDFLGKVLIALLPFAAVATLTLRLEHSNKPEVFGTAQLLRTMGVCFPLGVYDGFFGPGTGSFLLLGLFTFLRLDLVAASGTTKAMNTASNAAALITFLFHGQIMFFLGIPMAIANIAGNILGSRLALKRGPRVVRVMLLVSLSFLFVSLLKQYFFSG